MDGKGNGMKIGIYYFSSTGNTECGVKVLKRHLELSGHQCETISIEKYAGVKPDKFELLGFASPVFHGYPAQIMIDFIKKIPVFEKQRLGFTILCPCFKLLSIGYWGSRENFRDLIESKNIKVLAQLGFYGEASHPYVRKLFLNRFTSPFFAASFGKNRPDKRDEKVLQRFAGELNAICENYRVNRTYKPHDSSLRKWLSGKMVKPLVSHLNRSLLTKVVDEKRCTRCGYCVEACPVGAISMENRPTFDIGKCFHCQKCINLCPQNAIVYQSTKVFNRYKGRQSTVER